MNTSHNQQQKSLLHSAGLKVSLVRLKVLEVLQRAERQGQRLPSSALHAELMVSDQSISVLTVRQVLCRLCACGLVERDTQRRYRLRSNLPTENCG
ncbi:hypothetical protein [Aquipseudomonas campi]